MNELKTKLRNRKGFTLAELLIVVAIIAVLIGIAIPVFSAQLEKSRVAVDQANKRSAESIAVATYLLYEGFGDVTFEFGTDAQGNLGVKKATYTATTAGFKDTSVPTFSGFDTVTYAKATKNPNNHQGKIIHVTVNDGKVTAANWDTAS